MPPARAALPALTDTDVTELRTHLDRGVTPRVRLHAGGTGTVVSVGDPDTDGPEYIKVKVTLNGTRDTLPFAPEDLASTSRSPKKVEVKGRTPSPVSAAPAPPAPPPPAAPSSTRATRRPPRTQLRSIPFDFEEPVIVYAERQLLRGTHVVWAYRRQRARWPD